MTIIIILAIVLLSVVIAYILALKQISKHNFECKKCQNEFKVNWKKLLFVVHTDTCYEILCPDCNNKGCIEKINN